MADALPAFVRSTDQLTQWINAGAKPVNPLWIEACLRENRLIDPTGAFHSTSDVSAAVVFF